MARSYFKTHVVRTQQITPHLYRVVVGGESLAEYPDNGFADQYAKLVFPRPGADVPDNVDIFSLPPEQKPILRTYTLRSVDLEAREIAIDFVVHGDEGVAAPWAASAQPGDELLLSSSGGAYSPAPTADFHLLVGDEAAFPAIATTFEQMTDDAAGIALLEVDSEADQIELALRPNVAVQWIIRDPANPDLLLDRLRDVVLPAGEVQAFVHAELLLTRALKKHLIANRGFDKALLSASGYWRRGKTEDGFQAEKRELATTDPD